MAGNKDLFAPPTKEELDSFGGDSMFAPPSAQELKQLGRDYEAEATIAAEKKYNEAKPGPFENAALQFAGGATNHWFDEGAAKIAGALGYDEDATKANIRSRIERGEREYPTSSTVADMAGKGAQMALTYSPAGRAGRVALAGADMALDTAGRAEKLDKNTAIETAIAAPVAMLMQYGGEKAIEHPAVKQAISKAAKAVGEGADKVREWVLKKAGSVGFGVRGEATERYLAAPETMREVIDAGDDALYSLKGKADELYQTNVADPLRDAEDGYQMARDNLSSQKAALSNVRPPDKLAPEVIDGVKKNMRELSEASGRAFDALEGKTFDRKEILEKIGKIKDRLKIDGKDPIIGDQVPAYRVLEKLENTIRKEDDTLLSVMANGSEGEKALVNTILDPSKEVEGLKATDLKKLVQAVDSESRDAYGLYGSRGAGKHIKDTRIALDGFLKADEDYVKAMKPTAELAQLVSKMEDIFPDEQVARAALLKAADRDRGREVRDLILDMDKRNGTNILGQLDEYIQAQNILKNPEMRKTFEESVMGLSKAELNAAREYASAMNRVSPGSTENTIRAVSRGTGRNIEGEAQLRELIGNEGMQGVSDYGLAQDFQKTRTNGSRRVNFGGIIGAPLGAAGKIIGAMTGASIDVYGGQIWQKVLDGNLKLGKFAPMMESAASNGGPAAVGAMHIFLLENYPEYRELAGDLFDEKKSAGISPESLKGSLEAFVSNDGESFVGKPWSEMNPTEKSALKKLWVWGRSEMNKTGSAPSDESFKKNYEYFLSGK